MATVLERSLSVPYPGHATNGDPLTPGRAMRAVKPEAEEIAKKHKGTLCLFTDNPQYLDSPRRQPRVGPLDSSKEMWEYHRSGSVGGLLNGSTVPRPDPQPASRVRPEAQDIAGTHMGSGMAKCLNRDTPDPPASARRAPRVKPEAEENAEVHQGGRMAGLLHEPKRLPMSARTAPRVKPDGEENADIGKGRRMQKIMCKYGETPKSERSASRVKPEGEENADLDHGKRVGAMLTSYQLPNSARQQARVKAEGEDSANLDKGGRMSQLMHDANKLPPSPRPAPRTTTKQAKQIASAQRGSIAKIFSQQSKYTIVPQAGTRGGSAPISTKLW